MTSIRHAFVLLCILTISGDLLYLCNAAPPVFTTPASDGSTTIIIPEDSVSGTTILRLTATDFDTGTVSYMNLEQDGAATTRFQLVVDTVDTNDVFDFETLSDKINILSVQATTTSTGEITTVNFRVELSDVNDEPPTVSGNTTGTIAENQPIGTIIGINFVVFDQDSASQTYSITGDVANFQINAGTGEISTTAVLDYETATSTTFNVTLHVSDGTYEATQALTITLTDVNDNAPVFTGGDALYASIVENSGPGVSVKQLIATDVESVTYDIFGGDDASPKFALVGDVVQTTATPIDYESRKANGYKYTLLVTAADDTFTTTATLYIMITGENDFAPVWDTFSPTYVGSTTPFNIAENSGIGQHIVNAAATDDDDGADGSILYSLGTITASGGGITTGLFHIDPTTGLLVTATNTFERDTALGGNEYYDVVIKATDQGSSAQSVERTVRVGLTDVNDNTPTFNQNLYLASVSENDIADTSVVTVTATDKDETFTLAYTLAAVSAKFEMDGTVTNQINVKEAIDLDAGDSASYTLIIMVDDGGGKSSSTQVFVTVTNVNQHTPVFGADQTETVSESASVDATPFATMTATDGDSGTDGTITYTITGGDTNDQLYIDASTGEVTIVSALDFEATPQYVLQIEGKDSGSSPRSSTGTMTVNVIDENDNTPSCTVSSASASFDETELVGASITSLDCSDVDATDTVQYSFSSGNDGGEFTIDSAGAITLAKAVDYDVGTTSFALIVDVTDGTNTITFPVTVFVSSVNEAAPVFPADADLSFPETTAVGTDLVTYAATDVDLSPHGIVSYQLLIVSNTGSSYFNLDTTTATITLAKSLDFESLPAGNKKYIIEIVAYDGGAFSATGTITIEVTDTNDNTPACSPSSHVKIVAEDAAVDDDVIADFACTDSDAGTTLTYIISSQTPSSHFKVDTSKLAVASALDFETTDSYKLQVMVTDGSLSTVINVEIIITDVNDGIPAFNGGPYTAAVAENSYSGVSVADVIADDADLATSSFGKLIYSFVSGNDGTKFSIDPSTARISVAGELDADTQSTYNLVVQALEEAGTNSATVTCTVTVTDINDNSPSCTSAERFSVTMLESFAAGAQLYEMLCSDADAIDTVTYTLTSGDAAYFTLNTTVLELLAPIDYDTVASTEFQIAVDVSDGTNILAVTGIVTVTGVNEGPPVFTQVTYTVSKVENIATGSLVTTVTAIDPDKGDTVMYSWVAPESTFTLHASSGKIDLAGVLDREVASSYSLLVVASDGANAVTATVDITVTDENDNAPIFSPDTYSNTVSEGDAAGATVTTVTANDLDDPATNDYGTVSYIIASGGGASFVIGAATGEITTTAPLDYETATSYTLYVEAVDSGGAAVARTSTAQVTVAVGNVNEATPTFVSATISPIVSETAPIYTSIAQVVATDTDGGDDGLIFYTMSSHPNFALNSATGDLTVKSELDYDTVATRSYALEVVAHDTGAIPKSATATVSISVSDANDNSPVCVATSTTYVPEDTASGGTVATLVCTDDDSTTNSALTYTITSVNDVATTSPFTVTTGAIITTTTLDYETDTLYSILIEVNDGGVLSLTTTALVQIEVTDVNEFDPSFSGTPYSNSVPESAVVGTKVFTVVVADSDTSDTIILSIFTTNTYFDVDETTGKIFLKKPIDYDTLAVNPVELVVLGTDDGTNPTARTGTVTVTITVTNDNDGTPTFTPMTYGTTFSENSAGGATVLTVTATDIDDQTVTYSIFTGNIGSVFSVEANGDILVADDTNLDYDSAVQRFDLIIYAVDGSSLTGSTTVNIELTSYNEHTPRFESSSETVLITENSAAGTSVHDIVDAADADYGDDGVIVYSLVSGDDGKFSIDAKTGLVAVAAELDLESTTTYTIVVAATDKGILPSPLSTTFTLTVNVDDENDISPTCGSVVYTGSVAEDATTGTSVAQLACTDTDVTSPNNVISGYAFSGGHGGGEFAVSATGEVTTTAVGLDRETTTSYTLIIDVTDSGSSPLTTAITLNVDVTDVNDNDPSFSPAQYDFNIDEGSATGTTLGSVAATDLDTGVNAQVTYAITSGNDDGKFILDGLNLVTVDTLDYETDANTYLLQIHAIDDGIVKRTGTSSISVTMNDLNDTPPSCTQDVYIGSVAEDADATTTVLTAACTDSETVGNALVFSFVGGNTGIAFAIDSSNGEITPAATLDYETLTAYELAIQVTDGTFTTSVTARISVTDVNDETPQFSPAGPYTQTIDEELAVGTTVYDINATDADITATTFVFTIAGGASASLFSMDSATGIIAIANSIDRDDPLTPTHTLTVEVTDGVHTVTTSIVVTIDDINDNPPSCNPTAYVATLDEGTASGAVVTPACTDVDVTASPTLIYSITAGDVATFQIDSNTGVVTSQLTTDYENVTTYSLTVTVDDQGTSNLATTLQMIIDIVPINEASPVFQSFPYTTNILEDIALSTSVFQVTATDTDRGNSHGTVNFSIISGNVDSRFSIDPTTGDIAIAGSLDRETLDNYAITVLATDSVAGAADALSSSIVVTITVDDVNDNTPDCASPTVTFAEDIATNSTIATLVCTDSDLAPNSDLTYTIVTVNSAATAVPFSMTDNAVTLSTSLDYETVTSYTVAVEVKDGGTASLSTTTTVKVVVTDINEHTPAFQNIQYTADVPESTAAGDSVYLVIATDADTVNTITYTINPVNAYFDIDRSSGVITTKSIIDLESIGTDPVKMVVIAKDDGTVSAIRSASATVTITIIDVNDGTPLFNPGVYLETVSENDAVDTTVTRVTATDTDNAVLTYDIINGNTGNVFRIDATGDVVIADITLLDYDSAVQSYLLVVTAADDAAHVASATVQITVASYNEHIPSLSLVSSSQSVAEDAAVGYSVADIDATDADSGTDGAISYIITSGNADNVFSVNPDDGVVRLAGGLNREATTSYTIFIDAVDGGTNPGALSAQHQLTVNVDDVNDVTPICDASTYSASISEAAVVGTSVAQLVCSDGDDDPANINNDISTYTITSGDGSGHFAISTSGEVSTDAFLDREAIPSYNLKIRVSDSGSHVLTTTTTLTISITDENDNTPVFGTDPYNFNLDEDTVTGTTVGLVAASDGDSGFNAAISYSIASGNSAGKYALDSSTGSLTLVADLNYETDTSNAYVLEVQAIDQGASKLTGTTTVSVAVNDLNDNYPACTSVLYTGTVAEDADMSTTVLTIVCSDADAGSSLTYTIDSGNTGMAFSVGLSNGEITTTGSLDIETLAEYALTVAVTDTTHIKEVIVVILVTDVNDNTPAFDPAGPYTATMAEDEAIGYTVYDVGATDSDTSPTTFIFSITGGNTDAAFEIDQTSGAIKLAKTIDRDNPITTSYTLTLTVSDGVDATSTTSMTSIDVTIGDVNDNSPTCDSTVYTVVQDETTSTGITVLSPVCSDLDTSASPTLAYAITSGNGAGKFSINSATGIVVTQFALDYETEATLYDLSITVDDNGSPVMATTIQLVVTVNPVNEDNPLFSGAPYSQNVAEDASLNSQVFQVVATDDDKGEMHGNITFSLSAGNGDGHFYIDAATGWISVAAPLDRESIDSYALTVLATDSETGATDALSSSAIISITVDDVNDNTPDCTELSTVPLAEDTGTNSVIASLLCTDIDASPNSDLTYTIKTVNNIVTTTPFSVDAGGIMKLATNFNYEADVSYAVAMEVMDGGSSARSTTVTVNVQVTDVNEHTPVFQNIPYMVSVPETTVVKANVYVVTATDGDTTNTVTYSFNPSSSYFFIDPNTAIIYTIDTINFDALATNLIELVVYAEDDGTTPSALTASATVTVTVTNSNDVTPIFNPGVYVNTVNENDAVGTIVTTVTATDADDASVTYSFASGNDDNVFRIDPTGDIVINNTANLDYDSAVQSYLLVVHATDGVNTGTATASIVVTNYNDNSPILTLSISSQSVDEDSVAGVVIVQVAATDLDYGTDGNITYTITAGNSENKFSIDPTDGIVTLADELDRETTTSYVISIDATDGGTNPNAESDQYTLTITVNDVNDMTPVCTTSLVSATISESIANTSSIAQLTCSDADQDPANLNNAITTYNVISGDANGHFSISVSGEVTTTTSLDREVTPTYSLVIDVPDSGIPSLTTTVTLTVILTDENDGSPVFGSDPYSFNIDEGSTIGTAVGTITATDTDTGHNAAIAYNIFSGNSDSKFAIDVSTGSLTLAGELDYETDATAFVLEVRAVDNGVPANTGTTTVSIAVNNVNDNDPSCTKAVYTGSVSEAATGSTTVIAVTCTDTDPVGVILVYSVTSGDDGGVFDIGSSNGEITTALALDAETFNSYTLSVDVSDGIRTSSVTVHISVTDVNDETPQFDPAGPYSHDINEEMPVNSIVYDVNAVDIDVSATTFVYSITSENTGSVFAIDSDGVIKVAQPIDRDDPLTILYSLTIEVSDSIHTSTTSIDVTINDINDNSPSCDAAVYSASVDEGTMDILVSPACTDLDVVASPAPLLYTITAGDPGGGVFQIDTSTGIVQTLGGTDYEAVQHYTLTVTVDDQGTSNLVTSIEMAITINPVNENTPAFMDTPYTGSAAEDTALGDSVFQVSVTDTDTGNSQGSITFSITAGNSAARFAIDSVTGVISLTGALDRESIDSYALTVHATDSLVGASDARSSTEIVAMSVSDVNDNTPVCSPHSQSVSFDETTSMSAVIADLACTDDDITPNSDLVYTITSVNGVSLSTPFAITGTDVTLAGTFDYETDTAHTIVIEVKDRGSVSLSTTTTVNVQLVDINEFAPLFQDTPYATTFVENNAVEANVYQVSATDDDTANTVAYSIDGSSAYFDINTISGVMYATDIINFESLSSNIIEIVVLATDDGNSPSALSSSTTVTVTVTDINDVRPVFTLSVYTGSVSEVDPVETTVLTVAATDADDPPPTYAFASGNSDNVFRIDSTGEIVVDDLTHLDYDSSVKSYRLEVQATDSNSNVGSAVVIITVTNNNDFSPALTIASSARDIAEHETIGYTVVVVTATDSDHGTDGELEYTIVSGNGEGKFAINSFDGTVTLAAALDKEATDSFTVRIDATDKGTNPSALTSQFTLTVTVTDINDVTPTCTKSLYSVTISESHSVGTSVTQLICTDGDNDPDNVNNNIASYTITSGDTGGHFSISTSGEVVTTLAMDIETTASYSLVIKVMDSGVSSLSTTTSLSILLTDVNEHAPVFGSPVYNFNATEDEAVDEIIGTVSATDQDVGQSGEFIFSIDSGNDGGIFSLDWLTGELVLVLPLDYETATSHSIVVHAVDKGSVQSTGVATITVAVNDINDVYPTCTSTRYSGSVAENQISSTSVVTVLCSDLTDTVGSPITYTITGSDFAIDPNSGVVSTSSLLNVENTDVYNLVVTAFDGLLSVDTMVEITVTDVNDVLPTFTPVGPYTEIVSEDVNIGHTVMDVDALDAEYTPTTFIFSITGGNTGDPFTIDSNTGIIQTNKELDRDSPLTTAYTLDIEVSDGTGALALTATTNVVITIDDVNDNSPSCDQTTYTITLPENTASGTTVANLLCSDIDAAVSPTLAYVITAGNSENKFQVLGTGVVRTIDTLDYETTTSFTLTISIDDQGSPNNVIQISVVVLVEAVNEDTPTFSAIYTPIVSENTAIGEEVVAIVAADSDTGSLDHGVLQYEIIGGNSAGLFVIHQTTGSLTVIGVLNRENVDSYPLTVRVIDSIAGAADALYADTTVLITVADYNDNYPVFNPAAYTVSVIESASIGATLAEVTATDDDDGLAGTAGLQYSILDGNTDGKFGIISNKITLAAGVDGLIKPVYTLTIQAEDQGAPPLAATSIMTIQIIASNDYAPVFTVVDSILSLPESTAVGTSIYQAAATDTDTGDYGTLRYYMESGNTDTEFIIGESTGDMTVANNLDYDLSPVQYILIFRVEDTDTTMNTTQSATGTLTIVLTDVNDETPTFTENTYTTNLDENVLAATSVITVVANDADSLSNNVVSYTIISGTGSTLFSIDSNTGVVDVSGMIDYETATAYDLAIRAVDNGTPALSSTCVVQINIYDLNDETPLFEVNELAKMVAEDVPIGFVIITVNAIDGDSIANNNNVITYSFAVSSLLFSVESSSGDITVADQLDRETVAAHTLEVLATDGGFPTNTGTATVSIVLTDVNDKSPVISGTYDVTIAEDTSINYVVHTIVATDDDQNENAELTYAITGGDANLDFKISSGIIQVQKALDRETLSVYNLEVTVTDGGLPSNNAVLIATVTVSDVNDNAPVFQPNATTTYTFNVRENVLSATSVGRVSAIDADDGSNAVVTFTTAYFITGDSSSFTLDTTTGDINTATATLDREAHDTYSFVVRASDGGSPQRTSTVTVTITIDDFNDQTPTFQSAYYSATTAEQQMVGTSILTVTVVDLDSGVNSAITYTIDTSTAAGVRADLFFAVNSTTSILFVKQVIDRELDQSFSFSVIATDHGSPALTSTTSVSITVDDTNDNIPVFTPSFYGNEIAYNDDCQVTVATVTATDADGQIVTYSETSNPAPTVFSLAASSGVITMTTNADTDTRYLLDIAATDAGSPSQTSVLGAVVRIDTYDPNVVILNYYMAITKASYVSKETTFLSQLTTVYQSTAFSTAQVKRWCVTEETSGSCIVHTYVIKDDTADESHETGNTKAFLTSEEAYAVTSADTQGTPADVIVGSVWDPYSITRVGEYYSSSSSDDTTSSDTPWIKTTVGIIVVTVASAVAIALIVGAVVLVSKVLRKKSMSTPVEAGPGKGNVAKNQYYQKSALDRMFKEKEVASSNERFKSYDKTQPPPQSLVDMPLPTSPKRIPMIIGDPATEKTKFEPPKSSFYNYTNKPKIGAPTAEKPKQISNVVFRSTPKILTPTQPPFRQEPMERPQPTTPPYHPSQSLRPTPESKLQGSPVSLYSTDEPHSLRKTPVQRRPFVRTSPAPRPKPPDGAFGATNNAPIVINREFDGRAINPTNNRLYEYNTRTNERRWVNDPSGNPVTMN